MRLNAEWLAAPTLQRLMLALLNRGHDVYVVGGCVRNALMGLPISDIDLATDALPPDVVKIAEDSGFRAIPTGIDHGTITVLVDGAAYEVTTFRQDVLTDGRHAKVAFSRDIATDAQRRDFTMNALYANSQGIVFDPVGGLPDVAAKRVRFVGSAAARIAEDYLRILRFFRFSAAYADPALGIEPLALAACAEMADGLAQLSKERIGQEMRKLLAATDPAPALAAMAMTGVLARVLAGAQTQYIAPLVHIEAGQPRHWITRLALLGGEDVQKALRLSRLEQGRLDVLRGEMASDLTVAALGWRHGPEIGADILHSRAALFGHDLPANWRGDLKRGAAAICPVTAADFMPRLSGPVLGLALKSATQEWLNSDLRADKADLII